MELETLFRDVASVLSEKCINPESSRPYTISMLERALKDAHFSVDPKRPAKAQALEVGGRVGGRVCGRGHGAGWLPGRRGRAGTAASSTPCAPAGTRLALFGSQSASARRHPLPSSDYPPLPHTRCARPITLHLPCPRCPLVPFLQALPLLKSRFPIERARMRLKLLVPLSCKEELVELVRGKAGVLEEQEIIGGWVGGWVGGCGGAGLRGCGGAGVLALCVYVGW